MESTRHIVIVAPPSTSILDIAGPLEVFTKTADYLRSNGVAQSYTTHVLSVDSSLIVNTTAGLPVLCEGDIESINYEIDTILIAGRGSLTATTGASFISWLKNHASKIRRVGSICAGAFLLAETGLLDGRRAVTHWQVCDKLARQFPGIKVEKDPIYVKDGNIYTSAGISTGMDLALAMVEEDFGRDVSVNIARILVLYLKRPGNQSQFSNILMYQTVDHEPIQMIQSWIVDHLNEVLTVGTLAEKATMSPRNFARVFLKETGITPAKYVEKVRLETARRRLEETRLTIDEISDECGIRNADGLRRLFLRHMRTTPSEYRNNFSTAVTQKAL